MTVSKPNEFAAKADELAQQATKLSTGVAQLTVSVAELARAQKRMRRMVWITITGLILDLLLTVGAGLLFNNQRHNSSRIEEVQTRTSNGVLCPLYGLFVEALENQPPPPAETPAQKLEREHATQVIRDGYATLRCT